MPMNDRGFYIPVLSALTLAAFVLLIRFFPDVTNWELCEASRCTVQDWLAATAGWVGFLAAAVGAYFVYHQLAEQRRQTAFALGDGDPVFQVHVYAFDHTRAVLRFINWNRRTLAIHRIRIRCADVAIPMPIKFRWSEDQFTPGGVVNDCGINAAGWLNTVPGVEGWIDRQGRPDIFDFQLLFQEEVEDFIELIGGLSTTTIAEIIVNAQYEDGTERPIDFRLRVPVIDFLRTRQHVYICTLRMAKSIRTECPLGAFSATYSARVMNRPPHSPRGGNACRTSKLLSIHSGTNGSGGGIRTPDTRIMIPLL